MKKFFQWGILTITLIIMGCVWLAIEQNKTPTLETSEQTEESLQSPIPKERLTLTRTELRAREQELINTYGIETTLPGMTETTAAALYDLEDKTVENALVDFSHNGLTLKLPYNEGWGYPYYKLTPFEFNNEEVIFERLHPCPAGCLKTGAVTIGRITFSKDSFSEVLSKLNEETRNFHNEEPVCKSLRLNDSVTGTQCNAGVEVPASYLVIAGKEYTYTIYGLNCALANTSEVFSGKEDDLCKAIADSIKVE